MVSNRRLRALAMSRLRAASAWLARSTYFLTPSLGEGGVEWSMFPPD